MDQLLHWFWKIGIYWLLYGLTFISSLYATWKIIVTPLRDRVTEWQYRSRLRMVRHSQVIKRENYTNPFLKHIYLLVKSTSKENSEGDVYAFFIVSGLLFISTLVFSFVLLGDIIFSTLLGGLVGIIPYIYLNIRLRKIQFALNKEILPIIQQLTQAYNSKSYDMYYALVEIQTTIQNKELKRIFTRLISELQVSRNEEDIREVIEIFVFATQSSWTFRLGSIILKAYIHNENVLSTLLVLTRQIEEMEEMLEQEKSHSLDHVLNGVVTFPIFITSLVVANYVAGAQDWFSLQFGSKLNVGIFMVCIVLCIFSTLISMILRKPKNDL